MKQKNAGTKRKTALWAILIFAAAFSIMIGTALYVDEYGIPDFESYLIKAGLIKISDPPELLCLNVSVPSAVKESARSWAEDFDSSADGGDDESGIDVEEYTGQYSDDCTYVVSTEDEGSLDLVWKQYHVVVASRSSAVGSMTNEEFADLLGTGGVSMAGLEYTLAVHPESYDALDRKYGVGVSVEKSVDATEAVSSSDLTLGVIPFDLLDSSVHEVAVGGLALLENSSSAVVDELWVKDESGELFNLLQGELGTINYDPSKLASVVTTGTSVVGGRKLYLTSVEKDDWLYSVRKVSDILKDADIAHISNESSFVDGCVQNSWTMVFCGPTESFEVLKFAGVDVVGVTGNHVLDHGNENFIKTLDLYEDNGMQYFGGGRDEKDAHEPAIVDVEGVKFGFLGYNAIPPATYFAEGDEPGSTQLDKARMKQDIQALEGEVDYIFVDMQWGEEYEHIPNAYQKEYGHAAIDAGADFVVGVHPHWVQEIEHYKDGVIFYGLGNFLFDQTWSSETREGIMVKYLFYDGVYLGYELIPTWTSDDFQVTLADGEDVTRILGYTVPQE